MRLSTVAITVALFVCSLAQVMKCPDTTCRLKLCNDLLRQDIVREDFSPNMLRGNGIDMGGAFCYPRAGSSPRQLVNVMLGEAMVSVQKSGDPLVKISDFPDVYPSFPSNYFQTIKLPTGLEKITRRKARGDQFENTDNLCVVLPIKSYRMKRPDGSTSGKRHGGADDCVALRVQAMKLQFEMVWNNTDDIDFKVVEPTGFRIGRSNRNSPSGGRFNTDVVPTCGDMLIPGEQYRETISYDIDDVPPSGVYTAIARLFSSCGNGPVEVCLRVTLDGMVAKKRCKVIDESDPSSRQFFSIGFRM